MPKGAKKNKKQVRIYLDPEEERMLSDATKHFEGWTETDVLSLVSVAGLRGLKCAEFRFTWPLAFAVTEKAGCPDGEHCPTQGAIEAKGKVAVQVKARKV